MGEYAIAVVAMVWEEAVSGWKDSGMTVRGSEAAEYCCAR